MANPARGLGTQHETAIVRWLRAHGWPWADRVSRKGSKDEGDVRLSERIPFVIEAKTSRRSTDRASLGTWLRELEAEVRNAKCEGGAIVHKKRGTTDVGEYIVIMPMETLNMLLQRTYGELGQITPQSNGQRRRLRRVAAEDRER